MHHEPQIGLVEAHAECRGGDQRLHLVSLQRLFGGLAFGGVGAAGVGQDVVPGLGQEGGGVFGGRHGEAVDDAAAGQRVEVLGEPGQPTVRGAQLEHPEPQRVAGQRAAQGEHVASAGAELFGDVVDDPLVRGRGGGEHRDAVAEFADQVTDAPVVGAEVVAPVADAVRLIDHQQAERSHQPGQLFGPEPRVDQAFR